MMKIAVIDCGSNTFNLLIAEADRHGWETVFRNKFPVKLGSRGYLNHEIKEDRFYRGLDALVAHEINLRNYMCERVYAYATSAIRASSNGRQFLQRAKEVTGLDVVIIDGEKEAELIYKGVLQTLGEDCGTFLVMDIGGGSTEFIIADKKKVLWKGSFDLGVSRLFDIVEPSDPITQDEIKHIEETLKEGLKPLVEALDKYPVQSLIGSSGSFDTLIELYYYAQDISTADIKLSNEILLSAVPHIYDWIVTSTHNQRLLHPVIPDIRAEYMPISIVIMNYVLKIYPFKKLIHSAYSLKEGAMYEIVESIRWPEEIDKENERPEDYLEG